MNSKTPETLAMPQLNKNNFSAKQHEEVQSLLNQLASKTQEINDTVAKKLEKSPKTLIRKVILPDDNKD